MVRLAVVLVSLLAAPADVLGQASSYRYLSERGRGLFGSYVDAEIYRGLTEAQRTTFESIMHALESISMLWVVETVTAVWGESDHPLADGRDQFRLSVILADKAVEELLEHPDFEKDVRLGFGLGHVKLPSGTVLNFLHADSVRQEVRRPALQISWLEDDFKIGEIDIDYREDMNGHTEPGNSDVRDELPGSGGTSHYDLHTERYGEGLVQWWRSQ